MKDDKLLKLLKLKYQSVWWFYKKETYDTEIENIMVRERYAECYNLVTIILMVILGYSPDKTQSTMEAWEKEIVEKDGLFT